MFSIFALIAVIFSLLAIGGLAALGFLQVSKKLYRVGDLVRTTFSACPAVLTTALWGTDGEYGHENIYGPNYSVDAANALHCDMPGGVGLFSTWISDAGMNFKINPSYSDTPLYIFGDPCVNGTDCSITSLKCGPGYPNNGESLWQPNNSFIPNTTVSHNPAILQCPSASYCSLCGGPNKNNATGYCVVTDSNAVGNCISTEEVAWQCLQLYPSLNPPVPKVCAANVEVDNTHPSHKRFESCSVNQNFSSLSYIDLSTGLSRLCSDTNFAAIRPYFCTLDGNVNCMIGQECVANWGDGPETGWKVPGGAVDPIYEKTGYVCSGTIFPMVALQTDWIAEGKISSISGSRYYVDWQRVQNTYGGIGPSAGLCNTSSGQLRCYQPIDESQIDNSWKYSDCRFVRMDNAVPSRHLSVSNALLGTGRLPPQGLDNFSITDSSFTRNVLNILHVSVSTQGQVGNVFANPNQPIPVHPEYRPTVWNLSNVNSKDNLERIFFFSIHPMQASDETDGWADTNFSVVRNNLMKTIKPKP